jgi:hypothetical protein
VAWAGAERADFGAALPDGPLFTALYFVDSGTALGTAPTPDALSVRLLLRDRAGGLRELRRVPLDGNPRFDAVAAAGGQIVWAESTDARPRIRIWAADLRGGPARLLTADTGDALFYGVAADLTVADGRVHWAAAPGGSTAGTEIRSVPLDGGPVTTRTENGQWAQAGWPWLADQAEGRMRNTLTRRDTPVVTSGPETAVCGPVWCRVSATGRIDLMHPDGSARRRIAGGDARAAVTDATVLDRFALLDEPGPGGDPVGPATLLAYDTAGGRTVEVSGGVDSAGAGGGMLWWSTGADADAIVWHALDLRTVG